MTSLQPQLLPARLAPTKLPLALPQARDRRPPRVKAPQVSDREQARLRCRRALAGTPGDVRSLVVAIDRETALVVLAAGDQPLFMWRLEAPPGTFLGLGDDRLRARAHLAIDQARLTRLAGDVAQIVVTQEGRPSTRPVLLEVLLQRLGSVPVRQSD